MAVYKPLRLAVCFLVLWVIPLMAEPVQGRKAADVMLTPGFRPPSVPLVVVDPYLSVWSNADHLYDDFPRHWSGAVVCLSGMIRIDGKPYRFMAKDSDLAQDAMQQTNLTVYPTQTVYEFQQDGVQLNVVFSTLSYGAFSDDVHVLPMLPLTYLTFEVFSIDKNYHSVQVYYDNTAEGAVSDVSENVVWNRVTIPGKVSMRIGTEEQDYLGQGSDRINWGYWYVTVANDSSVSTTMAYSTDARTAFLKGQSLPPYDTNQPRPCSDHWPVLAMVWDLGGKVGPLDHMNYVLISYDQVFSIRYFGTAMAPLWRYQYSNSMEKLIENMDWRGTLDSCGLLDYILMSALDKADSTNYTTISSLAWRQTLGGTVSVWNNVTKEAWMFLKEISSDGDVSTVDVIYPASPLFLTFSVPTYSLFPLKYILLPILSYANNETAKYGLDIPYNLAWAPHHLGHWPICDLPPNRQEQMPMEESGNMLTMIAGIVYTDTGHNLTFLEPYWPLLKIWADYTVASLPDPGDQLCTDDFEGPSPHNVNLAAKGIVGLGAYSYLLRLDGQSEEADHYDQLNKAFIQYWMTNASDGDHYRRQYNLSDSWSLKYNLLYQKILKLQLFPDSVFEIEENYYQTQKRTYGIPLDDRHPYAKTDWEMWTAAMGSQEQFVAITDAVYKFANETPDRVPFSDWYDTTTGKRMGFTARPVIGGLYARLLIHMEP